MGVFNFYSGEKDFFDAEEIELLIEAAGDVSFALNNFKKEATRKRAELAVITAYKNCRRSNSRLLAIFGCR